MKILYDHHVFSMQAHGGISRYFQEISRRLTDLGESVSIFAPFHVNQYLREHAANSPIGICMPKLRGTTQALDVVCSVLGSLMVRPRNCIDIFHQTYYSTSTYAPRRAIKVLTVHDMIHELFPESFSNNDVTCKKKRISIERADHVICISENTRRDLINLTGFACEKTSVVHLGYSLMSRSLDRGAASLLPPYLLYVGNRDGYKNFGRLLSAYAASAALMKDFKLVCFGGGALTPGETSLVRNLGLTGRIVQVAGNDDLLSCLYSSAAALVYPSLYEGFGIPPLEAMSHDCPVICSDAGSIPEVVGEAGRMFNPVDVDEMSMAIEEVVYSDKARQQLVGLGQSRLKNFSWQKCATETLQVYQRLKSDVTR